MPADCWSSGVILYIMLSCVLYFTDPSDCLPLFWAHDPVVLVSITNYSGSHPFDNEPRPSSNWIARIKDSHQLESSQQFSESYAQADIRLKEKIVHGEVQYFQDPWRELPDGLN